MKNYIKIKNDTQNMTALIKEISENIKEDCDNIIEFEKGTYNFNKEFSEKFPIYASSARNGENHVIFNFSDNKNITINGNGSEFVFCDRVQPFMFTNCENITLKNFSTDYSFLRYAYAEVIEVLDDGIHIFINNNIFDYYVNDDSLCFVCGEEILSTATRKISIKRLYPEKSGVVFLYAGYTLTDFNGAAPNIFCNVEKTEQGVFLKYSSGTQKFDFKPGDIICLAYDNDREAQMFFFENSKNIVLENVSVYRNGGMVFVADLCEDILIDNLKIQIKDGRNEYFSSTADGIYLTQCSGSFTLRNSKISNTYDDAINIHGYYSEIRNIISDKKIELGFMHPAHWGLIPCKKGDILKFSTFDDFNEVCEAKVVDISNDDNRENIIVTLESTENLKCGMLVENPGRMPKVIIEKNCVEDCPHMRLSAPEMIIRDNFLNLNDTDIYIYDLIDFWTESGAVESVVISDNKFGEKSSSNIIVGSCRPEKSNRLHGNITIENNKFIKNKNMAIKISHVKNLVERNNLYGVENDYN